jgi:hypothetical protein
MSEDKEEIPKDILPTRRTIHSEIEERIINRLFTVVSEVETKPSGEPDFSPYTDHVLIQLETFLEKKFDEHIFSKKQDKNILYFLEEIKKERDRREFAEL